MLISNLVACLQRKCTSSQTGAALRWHSTHRFTHSYLYDHMSHTHMGHTPPPTLCTQVTLTRCTSHGLVCSALGPLLLGKRESPREDGTPSRPHPATSHSATHRIATHGRVIATHGRMIASHSQLAVVSIACSLVCMPQPSLTQLSDLRAFSSSFLCSCSPTLPGWPKSFTTA